MNEGFSLFLHLDEEKREENEILIRRIDEFLLNFGIRYSGIANYYVPTEEKERDNRVFAACQALKDVVWLQGIYDYVLIAHRTNVCPLDAVLTDRMSKPSKEKLRCYENYCLSSGKLAHGIVVNEYRQIRDGYISYLLAQKYGIQPDIFEGLSNQPLKKVVKGCYVMFRGNEWRPVSGKRYRCLYSLKHAVVPGDILQVEADKGLAFMKVENIEYAAGDKFCGLYRKTKRHV